MIRIKLFILFFYLSHVLADIAEKMNDEGIKNQIDNFKDLTEVANFPATIITSKLTDYIAEERKKSIRRLKKKLIKEHNIVSINLKKLKAAMSLTVKH